MGTRIEVCSMFRVTQTVLGAGIHIHNISAGRIEKNRNTFQGAISNQQSIKRRCLVDFE